MRTLRGMAWSLLLLLLTGLRSSTSFLPVSQPPNPITASVTPIPSWLMPPGPYRHRPPPLWMGGKWVRDPSITQGRERGRRDLVGGGGREGKGPD